MKLTVLIEGKETTLSLLRSITVSLYPHHCILDYNNISNELGNNVIGVGGTTVTLPDGNYSINNIIDVLKGEKATLSFKPC